MRIFDQFGRLLLWNAPVSIDDLVGIPAGIADGFLKRNSANNSWQEVAYGSGANTVCQGNDSRLLAALDRSGRVFSSALPNVGTTITLASDTAYFVYLGRVAQDLVPKFVEFYVVTLGSGAQVAEVGLFSTPNAPNKSAQSHTKLISTGTVDALTGTGVKRNSVAFATTVVKGTHLWAGLRSQMATTQPAISGLCVDMNQGRVASTSTAGALTGAGPWTGAIPLQGGYPSSAVCPDLRVTLD